MNKWNAWAWGTRTVHGVSIEYYGLGGEPRERNKDDPNELPACQNHHWLTAMVRGLVPGTWVCPKCHSVFDEGEE